ncbi:ABC transporter permease [Christiangramia flava]|uniref:ABC transporter permease protein n=1 Tax=Christiangramia flava JLT2011 TaxID=1229726 RepID=A0A1L7I521_9FLAO|nr:ABC transporter permease [Christiangramia flava]APU68708.1 ABC transporter permease protein [Christiangramia flava JLT2011]OSS38233.1 ABC transporter permease protein [Christiangramia flava JLT2011]
MFDLERWDEIFETIRKNKLRTFLTGLSVASGIFILVILLGVGQGMQNGIAREFERDASNLIFVFPGVTSKEYKGLNPGRRIQLKNEDYNKILLQHADMLDKTSAVYQLPTGDMVYKKENGSYRSDGVFPAFQVLENISLTAGRFINMNDLENREKVVVIGRRIQLDLFKKEDPIGKTVKIGGVGFKVIGTFTDPGGEREESRFAIPITTAQTIYGGGNDIARMYITLKQDDNFDEAVATSQYFTGQLEQFLKNQHTIAPDDNSAIYINNTLENAKRFFMLMKMIRLFFWGVGIFTIIAGVVGVSNIMLIIVKERTREIGIRKALGAQPWSIIGMILHESIFVTAIAGFTGLILSLLLLEVFGPQVKDITEYIYNPSVNFSVAVNTVILLVIAGAVAGFFPAWRAARIKPIVALRDE